MKNLIKLLVSILCMISTSGNLFCQEPVDSLKIGEEYREYRYLYADNPDRAIALYDSTKEIIDTFITLKIDSIKRLYKVLNIDSFVNFNDKKYNLIAITDHLDNWDWTIISEYATDSCDDKLEINKSYYMTIYYFENEDFAIRIPWNSLVEIFFDGDSVFIDKKHEKTRIVHSPNIKGGCFIPTD